MNQRKTPSIFNNLSPDEAKLFDELSKPPVSKITINEHLFVTRYLPMLYNFYTGEINPEYINKFRATWIRDIARTGYNEVRVVDNKGEVVAVVPPTLGRVQYAHKDGRLDVASAFKKHNSIALARGEVEATRLLKMIMFNATIKKEAPLEDRWMALFAHYKCNPSQQDTTQEATLAKPDFNEDDYTYEL